MKKTVISGLLIPMAFIIALPPVTAQHRQTPKGISDSSEQIIIDTKKNSKKLTVTIEIDKDQVKVNGKPLAEFKDDNITIRKKGKVIIHRNGDGPLGFDFPQGNIDFPYIEKIEEQETEGKAYLGVMTEKNDDGARITQVLEKTPADKAGLKEGDIVVSVNEKPVAGPEDLSDLIGTYKPEDKIAMVYKRDGKNDKATITLGKRKSMNVFSFSKSGRGIDSDLGTHNFHYSIPDHFERFFDMPSRPRLGIKAQETEEGNGVKIMDVDKNSPAEKAGLKAGDVIVEINGRVTNDLDELIEGTSGEAAKNAYTIKYDRNGKVMETAIKIPKKLRTTNL